MRKRIIIDFIPQEEQRIPGQIGDYFETPVATVFQITDMPNPAHSMACLIHELHEKFRNDQFGITDESVDQFDLAHLDHDDPGLLPDAPYHKTHMEADALERLFVVLSGNDWVEYEKAIENIFTEV